MKELLDRPIAYHRSFTRLGGGVTAAVFLSQAFFWQNRASSLDGWFYKTADDWRDETGLTRRELQNAREHWTQLGVLEVDLRGMPATLHFRVNIDALVGCLSSLHTSCKQDCTPVENKFAQDVKTCLHDVGNSVCTTCANLSIEQRLPKTTSNIPASTDAENSSTQFLITKRKRKLQGWKLYAFMRFWETFDFKHGRAEAADAWLDIPDLTEAIVEQIVFAASVEAGKRHEILQRNGTPKWAQGWLTARRWEDEAYQPKQKRVVTPEQQQISERERARREAIRFNEYAERIGKPNLKVPVPE